MGKILVFEELSDKVLEEVKTQNTQISRELITPENYTHPFLIGIKNYKVPHQKIPYDLMFHYILKKNKDKFESIKPAIDKGLVVPIVPVHHREPALNYLMAYMNVARSKNPSINTFAIRDKREKKIIKDGKEDFVCPTLTFFRWKKKKQRGHEVVEIPDYPIITQEKFIAEYYPENPEKQKHFFDSLRAKIDKAHPAPQNPMFIIIDPVTKQRYDH